MTRTSLPEQPRSETYDLSGAGLYKKVTLVTADVAHGSGTLPNGLQYTTGQMIATNWDGTLSVIAADVWPATYAPSEVPGKYRKTVLAEAAPYWGPPRAFRTREGPMLMHTRDWVLQAQGGALDDRYPVTDRYFRDNYHPVQKPSAEDHHRREIAMLARICHDEWRKPLRIGVLPRYQYTPRAANDAIWTMLHNGRETLDLANTDFADLPAYWQAENMESARIAIQAVDALIDAGIPYGQDTVRQLAARINAAWSGRHPERSATDRAHFEALPPAEQRKSLAIAGWALAMKASVTVESHINLFSSDPRSPGGLGSAADGGPAPESQAFRDVRLPDHAVGFAFRDKVTLTDAKGLPVTLVTEQSSVYLPGARSMTVEEIAAMATRSPLMERHLHDGFGYATTRVPGVIVPVTYEVEIIDDVFRSVAVPQGHQVQNAPDSLGSSNSSDKVQKPSPGDREQSELA